MKIFCKFPTVNISKLNFLLVICIAKNFIWTTLKVIFSIFRFCRFSNSWISAKYTPILTNHTSIESLFIQFKKLALMTGFCGPGSHILWPPEVTRQHCIRSRLKLHCMHCLGIELHCKHHALLYELQECFILTDNFFLSWQVWCQWWWKKPLDSFWFLITVFVVDKKGQKHHKNISNRIYCGLMKSSELCMRRRQNFNIYIYLCIWQALSSKVTNIAFKVHILYKNTCIAWEWNPLHNKHHFFYCLSYKNASYELIIDHWHWFQSNFFCRQKEPKTTIKKVRLQLCVMSRPKFNIYIYAFDRCFYAKWLILQSRYTFYIKCLHSLIIKQ